MARYIVTVTNRGAEVLTQFTAAGRNLNIYRAQAGDGITQEDPATVTSLVSPLEMEVLIGAKQWVAGSPGHMLIPIEITNRDLTENAYIREIATWAYDINNNPFVFTYAKLDGSDSDNILPPPKDPDEPDTSHIHNMVVEITSQEYGSITVEIAPGFGVTYTQMVAYAAPLVHTQAAATIQETTGENTEEAQRRQDNTIMAIESRNTHDATASYTPGYFELSGLSDTLPDKFTLRFTAPAAYTSGDQLRAGARVWDVVTVAKPEEGAPDGVFGENAVVSVEVDTEAGKAFFKSGGGSYGTLPAQAKMIGAVGKNLSTTIWFNSIGTASIGTRVVLKEGSMPENITDGVFQDIQGDISATFTELTNGITYYARLFSYNDRGEFQTSTENAVASVVPTTALVSYTGDIQMVEYSTGKWWAKLTTSGVLSIASPTPIDIFLCGAGGGGGIGGGAAGYRSSSKAITLPELSYVQIGEGTYYEGGMTYLESLVGTYQKRVAEGGARGWGNSSNRSPDMWIPGYGAGGADGGGGSGSTNSSTGGNGGAGGQSGGDGASGYTSSNAVFSKGGEGWGISQYAFGGDVAPFNTAAFRFGGGGGGCCFATSSSYSPGAGGAPFGGRGGKNSGAVVNAQDGRGPGGGGGGGFTSASPGKGGPGICVLRWSV